MYYSIYVFSHLATYLVDYKRLRKHTSPSASICINLQCWAGKGRTLQVPRCEHCRVPFVVNTHIHHDQKVCQRLYFLRRLKKFAMNVNIIFNFYSCTTPNGQQYSVVCELLRLHPEITTESSGGGTLSFKSPCHLRYLPITVSAKGT